MIKRNYYCLVAGLPDLLLEQSKRPMGLLEFKQELKHSLHPEDYSLVELLFLPHDHKNLLNLLQKKDEPFEPLGRYERDDLEEAVKEPAFLPEYLQQFIEQYKEAGGVSQEKSWENQLTESYYAYVDTFTNSFLIDYFTFEKNLRNVLVAYNCRKFQLPVEHELIGEDGNVDALKKSQARDFGLGGELDFIDRLLVILENKDLLGREKGLDLLRWNYLDDITTFHYFTIEVILSYVIKLRIIDRWLGLDAETGNEFFGHFLSDLKDSYDFSTEFSIYARK